MGRLQRKGKHMKILTQSVFEKWGNPFKITPERTQTDAVIAFRIWLFVDGCHANMTKKKQWILENLPRLKGKNLSCFCKEGTPCHVDVLLEIANRE